MPRDERRPIDPTRLRVNQRERALGRLSRLTTASAIAGTFATVGFGGLAAITYGGTPAGSDPVTVDDTTSTPQANSTNPSNSTGSLATQQPSTHQFVPAQPPSTTTHRRTHVSSGGSG